MGLNTRLRQLERQVKRQQPVAGAGVYIEPRPYGTVIGAVPGAPTQPATPDDGTHAFQVVPNEGAAGGWTLLPGDIIHVNAEWVSTFRTTVPREDLGVLAPTAKVWLEIEYGNDHSFAVDVKTGTAFPPNTITKDSIIYGTSSLTGGITVIVPVFEFTDGPTPNQLLAGNLLLPGGLTVRMPNILQVICPDSDHGLQFVSTVQTFVNGRLVATTMPVKGECALPSTSVPSTTTTTTTTTTTGLPTTTTSGGSVAPSTSTTGLSSGTAAGYYCVTYHGYSDFCSTPDGRVIVAVRYMSDDADWIYIQTNCGVDYANTLAASRTGPYPDYVTAAAACDETNYTSTGVTTSGAPSSGATTTTSGASSGVPTGAGFYCVEWVGVYPYSPAPSGWVDVTFSTCVYLAEASDISTLPPIYWGAAPDGVDIYAFASRALGGPYATEVLCSGHCALTTTSGSGVGSSGASSGATSGLIGSSGDIGYYRCMSYSAAGCNTLDELGLLCVFLLVVEEGCQEYGSVWISALDGPYGSPSCT